MIKIDENKTVYKVIPQCIRTAKRVTELYNPEEDVYNCICENVDYFTDYIYEFEADGEENETEFLAEFEKVVSKAHDYLEDHWNEYGWIECAGYIISYSDSIPNKCDYMDINIK